MMMLTGVLLFSGSLALAAWTILSTVLPKLDRIRDALAGRPADHFHPLSTLVRAERRIAVRRWATTPRGAAHWRAAA